MQENLFSYGTLQNERIQMKLFGRLLNGRKDILTGYKTSVIEIKDKLFLSKSEQKEQLTAVFTNNKNDFIEGTVFEISEEELFSADKYEPDNFNRLKVELESGKNAWVYAADEAA
jgi:gamma-glutamylcyclotransferase (GGCT)/AIG2-like uncharacterized protein YtfP